MNDQPIANPSQRSTQSHAENPGEQEVAICTIVSKNYLAYARVFARSVQRYHPRVKIFVLLVDRIEGRFDRAKEPFETVTVEELTNIPNPSHLHFKYDVMELNTAVKPYFLSHLFEKRGFQKVIYFDPDILVTGSLSRLFELLDQHMMVLTPHITQPYEDAFHPNEIDINLSGIFNLGFIALANRGAAGEFLRWWQSRLYDFCASEVARGLFTDQRWVNFAPTLYEGVHILRDPAYNIAYWNLHYRARHLRFQKDGLSYGNSPAVFFHFSGFDINKLEQVSKHQNRFQLCDLPQLRPLFERYRELLLQNGHHEASQWPYAFDFFKNGIRIPTIARKVYRDMAGQAMFFGDPFESEPFGSYFRWLNLDANTEGKRETVPITNLLAWIYLLRPDLQRAFKSPAGEDSKGFKDWLLREGTKNFKLDAAFVPRVGTSHNAEVDAKMNRATVPRGRAGLPFGVNVSGFLSGEFGNGETARANVRALQSADIPCALNGIRYSLHRHQDRSLAAFSTDNPYAVNLIHVNADTTHVFRNVVGQRYFKDRHNIGLWWWELEHFPERWRPQFEFYDEIWTQSSFCQKSIARRSPIPVKMIPHVVHVDEGSLKPDRARFGIEPGTFAFLFTFDYMSFIERKNPLALLRAFRAACAGREAVLVIKSINGHCNPAKRAELKQAAEGLNVRFIDEHLTRPEVLSLVAACDCYVSLHRAEGFGQGLAEAMFLSKPTIATNYSGNTDFMTADNSFLVRYRLVELERDFGPYQKGSTWAEPNVEHAAELMRFVSTEREVARAKGQKAALDIRKNHSAEHVGSLMKERLLQITGGAPRTNAPTAIKVPDKSSTLPKAAVSIVIPTFNRIELTRQCLQAVRQNTPADQYEVVVVDNGSTDGTADFLKTEEAAGRLRAICNIENVGFARACNQGAAAARGGYIVFLNNDTEVQPGWLQALVSTAESDPQVGAVGSKLLFPDSTIQHAGVVILDDRRLGDPLLARHAYHRAPRDLAEANRPMCYQALTAACLLVPRELFARVGGFDEQFWNGYEDVDLCFRLAEAGRLAIYQPASVVMHHESQSGPERFRKVPQNIARLHEKWLGRATPDFVVGTDGQMTKTEVNRLREYPGPAARSSQGKAVASIIIPVLNQLGDTRQCLESIVAHTTVPHEVIIVDNGSNEETFAFLKGWQKGHANCKLIRNSSNRGYAAANNQGLSVATGDHLILLNNDTVVTDQWLEGLLRVLEQHPGAGIVGPMSNNVSGPQYAGEVAYCDLRGLPAFAKAWSESHQGQSIETPRAVGFCLLMGRSVFEKIGGLDESFGSGNFEDDDLCIRSRIAGFRIRIARDVFIHHSGSQTFKGARINYRQAMLRNWEIFRNKWHLPPETTLESGYPVPSRLPEGIHLKVEIRRLEGTHEQEGEGCWMQKAPKSSIRQCIPGVASLGNLMSARELLQQRNLAAAWKATLQASTERPFHPEAFVLLAEIAAAAGDSQAARQCAQHARVLAPDWKAVRHFLQKSVKGKARPDWLLLPEALTQETSRDARNAPRITVCVIAKNEEQFLGQCLESVKDLASQVVLVDTGSTDRTVEIAKSLGAEVYQTTWSDDFSAARNAALEHARGDWVLILDADEELPADQHAPLKADLRNRKNIALRLPLVNRGQETEGCSFVPRLFRNAPGVYFTGRIHEQVFPSLIALGKVWGLDTALGSAQILHHGYSKENLASRNKIERNLRLLRQAVDESPDDPNLAMNLGLESVRSGDLAAGLLQYRRAFELMSARTAQETAPELREALLTQFTSQLYKAGAHGEVIEVLSSPLARQRGLTASLYFALGLALFASAQYEQASEQMRQCLAKRDQRALTPINTDIRTAAPYHCLALALAKSGDIAGAERAFQGGLKEKGREEEIRLDYAKFLLEQDRAVEALQGLHEFVTGNPQAAVVWRLGAQIALNRADFLEFACDWTAEAVKHLPEDLEIRAQRAEALLLSVQVAPSRELWQTLWQKENQSRAAAALVICELMGEQGPAEFEVYEAEVGEISRAFIGWYQRCLAMRAQIIASRINERLESLRSRLPGAANMIEAALAEARAESPETPEPCLA